MISYGNAGNFAASIYTGVGTGGWVGSGVKTGSYAAISEPTGNVPEPVTLALLGIGLLGIGINKRNKPQ